LSFCGFRKPHPHSTDSIIRVAFHNQIDKVGVSGYFQGACDSAINAFTKIMEQMGGEVSKVSSSAEKSTMASLKKSGVSAGKSPSPSPSASKAEAPSVKAGTSSKHKLSKTSEES